jgi:hypothetical protein
MGETKSSRRTANIGLCVHHLRRFSSCTDGRPLFVTGLLCPHEKHPKNAWRVSRSLAFGMYLATSVTR